LELTGDIDQHRTSGAGLRAREWSGSGFAIDGRYRTRAGARRWPGRHVSLAVPGGGTARSDLARHQRAVGYANPASIRTARRRTRESKLGRLVAQPVQRSLTALHRLTIRQSFQTFMVNVLLRRPL